MEFKKILVDLSMPVFFIGLSIWLLIESASLNGEEGMFPTLIGGFMLIVAVFILFTTLKQKNSKVNFKNINKRKVVEVIVALILYVALFKLVGYIIDTFLLCSYVIITLGYKRYKLAALYAAGTTIVVFAIFKLLLGVPLPVFLAF
ncbi:MAG: tripartite tricarboxylate transporter TctB family protein [Treponemataceae bacterium]